MIGIFTNLRRCHFANRKFREVDFYEQKLACDPRIGCKSPSNLLELLERDMDLEEEFEKFERDEIVEFVKV